MMATLRQALDKMRHDVASLRSGVFYWHGGRPVVHMPRRDASPVVATCYIINAVSLLDEGLEAYLSSRGARGAGNSKLAERIDALKKAGILKNAVRLHKIRKVRNAYAHKLGKYGDWPEFDNVLKDVDQTFRQLGLI